MATMKDKATHKGKKVLQPVITDPQAEQIAKATAEREARAKAAQEAAEAAETETATTTPANAETAATGETEAPHGTLESELAKVTAEHVVPELTAEQEAAIAEAVKAFNALTAEQVIWFAQKVKMRLPKQAAEKKAKKAEIDPKLFREVKHIFTVGEPTEEHYALVTAAKRGEMPVKPDFSDKKAEIYHQVAKSKHAKSLVNAVNARDIEQIDDIANYLMTPTHTANRAYIAYGRLALIALTAQGVKR